MLLELCNFKSLRFSFARWINSASFCILHLPPELCNYLRFYIAYMRLIQHQKTYVCPFKICLQSYAIFKLFCCIGDWFQSLQLTWLLRKPIKNLLLLIWIFLQSICSALQVFEASIGGNLRCDNFAIQIEVLNTRNGIRMRRHKHRRAASNAVSH